MFGRPRITDSISISEMKHMREVEGMSNQQIADRLGISIGAVYNHLGKRPKEMTEKNLANKRCRKKNKLPVAESLPAAELPEMPRESFKERCERMAKACEPATHPLSETVHKHIDDELVYTARPEKLAKYAETSSLSAEPSSPYTKYKGDTKHRLPFPELIAVFGPETVRSYLRVALYANAVEHWDVQRDDMVKALEGLNKALNCSKEANVID